VTDPASCPSHAPACAIKKTPGPPCLPFTGGSLPWGVLPKLPEPASLLPPHNEHPPPFASSHLPSLPHSHCFLPRVSRRSRPSLPLVSPRGIFLTQGEKTLNSSMPSLEFFGPDGSVPGQILPFYFSCKTIGLPHRVILWRKTSPPFPLYPPSLPIISRYALLVTTSFSLTVANGPISASKVPSLGTKI